jgi:hypothetical protein
MKVWIYVEQSEDWDMVAECPDRHSYWVADAIQKQYPTLSVEYGTEKPSQPLKLSKKG